MNIYLYKKTHQKTRLMYLGKTTKDPYKYHGSGKDWLLHLRIYGYNIDTEILKECSTMQELSYWGRYYSNLFHVVTAMDDYGNKIWANRIPETGGGGPKTEITKQKLRNLWENDAFRKNRSQQTKIALNKPEAKIAMSAAQSRIKNDPKNKLKSKNNAILSWRNTNTRKKRMLSMKLAGNNIDFKQKMSCITSGKNNPGYDNTVYTWRHSSGITEQMTRFELYRKYSLHAGAICLLLQGKRRNHKGWSVCFSN